MKRGVLSIFGSMNSQTADTLRAFTNSYHLPFITWSNPIMPTSLRDQLITKENDEGMQEIVQNYQLYMHPDLSPVLISLIKQYKWRKVFYLYDHDDALKRIESIFSYQTDENDFTTQLNVRKITSLENCVDILK